MILRELPQIFQIESTSVCNLRCTMCPYSKMTRPKVHMKWGLFTEIAKYFQSGQKVGLHVMGEPLLYPRIVDMVQYLTDRSIKAELATNCTVMSRELALGLIDAKLHEIWFSFDSANPTLYESIRVGARFEQSFKNVLLFLKLNQAIGEVRAVVQKVGPTTDIADSRAFIKLWEGWDARVKFMDSWAGTMNLDKIESPPIERYPCAEPWNRVAILVNGDVVPCCRDWEPKYVYGNILEQSLHDIWHGEKAQRLRDDIISGTYSIEPCASCREWWIPMDREVTEVVYK